MKFIVIYKKKKSFFPVLQENGSFKQFDFQKDAEAAIAELKEKDPEILFVTVLQIRYGNIFGIMESIK